MRKVLTVTVALLFSAVACVGEGPSQRLPGQGDFQTYADEAHGFTIGYPSEWHRQEGVAGSQVAFLAPPEGTSDAFRENVNVVVQVLPEASLTLDLYTKLSLEQAPTIITGFRLLDQGSTTLSGAPAHEVHYRGKQGIFRLEWGQVWTVEDGKAYVLTYTAERKRYEADRATAEAMFETFRLP